jgi:hypothetical protein
VARFKRARTINNKYLKHNITGALDGTHMYAFQDKSMMSNSIMAPGGPQMSYLGATKSSNAGKAEKKEKKKKKKSRE